MKVEIDSVIDSAKFNLGLRDTTYPDADLERLIDEGSRHMGKLSGFVVSCETLEIDCATARLPKNIVSDDIFALNFNTNGCTNCCNYTFNPANQINPFNQPCGCPQYWVRSRAVLSDFLGAGASCNQWGGVFDIQSGYIKFPTNINQTSVKVWYTGWNQDVNGIMFLDELDQRGLAAYASWKYSSAGQNYKAYSPDQIRGWKNEWIAQKNMRIAQDFKADHKAHIASFAMIARAIVLSPSVIYNRNL